MALKRGEVSGQWGRVKVTGDRRALEWGYPRAQVGDPGRGEPSLESKMEGRSVFPSCPVMGTLQRAFTWIISSKPVQSEK